MAITFDAATNGGLNPASWSHTCGSLGNRFLIVAFDGTNRPTAVTYAGVSMAAAGTVANGTTSRTIALWYLANPASGSNSIAVTGGSSFIGISLSYAGVKQVGFPDASNTATGSGTTHSVSVTTTVGGCWTVAFTDSNGANATAGASTTRRSASGSYAFEAFDSNAAVALAGVSTLNFANAGSVAWASIGVSMAPHTGGFFMMF